MDAISINIKEELHQMINDIDDIEFLKAVQTILISRDNKNNFDLTDEELNVLKEREAKYLSGKSKTYTWEEVKRRLKPGENV